MTTNAAVGHFFPLVPTAQALLTAGHDVRVACPARFAPTVLNAGLKCISCDETEVEEDLERPTGDREARLQWAITKGWPYDARSWTASLLEHARLWQPHMVIVEPVEHAGRLAAAALHAPLIEHGWGFTLPAGTNDAANDYLRDLYAANGLTPRLPDLTVDLAPGSVQAGDAPALPRYRYLPWSNGGAALPDRDPGDHGRILVTLGTQPYPLASERLHSAIVAASECAAQVVAVLGGTETPLDLPSETLVLPWVDLPSAAAAATLVVHHGGAGSSWATICAGRAAVCLPQVGDQFRNAAALDAVGACRTIEPDVSDRSIIADTISSVLSNQDYERAACRLRESNNALPGVEDLARDIVASW